LLALLRRPLLLSHPVLRIFLVPLGFRPGQCPEQ